MTIAPYAAHGAEVATRTNGTALASQPPPRAVVELAEWAQSAQAAYEVATHLVQTSFVPDAFRNKPHEATAAILSGSEVGLSPMASLRAFDVINGTAAPRAITLRAIVQSQGHEVWEEEQTSTRAIVCGRRRGSAVVQRSEWTLDRAKGLNLLGKPNWKNQPGAMLVARATGELCRLVAADAILGMPYSIEELADGGVTESRGEPAAAAPAEPAKARRTAQRTKPPAKPAPAEEPPVDDLPPLPGEEGYDDEPPTDLDNAATGAQITKIHATLNDFEITDRAEKLRICGLLAGRQLDSSKDLSKADASKVIETLTRLGENRDPLRALDVLLGELEGAAS
jgi:hypothetical protein